MTQQEFLSIAQQYPDTLNVWVTDTLPYTILGLTVPVVDSENINVASYLEQVQIVTLPVDESQAVQLQIIDRSTQYSIGIVYYFFTVEQLQIANIGDLSVLAGSVIFSPGSEGGLFSNSPYNALQGNAEQPRQSAYIFQYGSITKANIQDSLYSDTGWTNARYNGSKTDKAEYISIEPAIAGNTFDGSYYSRDVTDIQIADQTATDRVYVPYFHTGKEQLPNYNVSFANAKLQGTLAPNLTTATISLSPYEFLTPASSGSLELQVGDLLKISMVGSTGSTDPTATPEEVVKLESISKITGQETYIITLKRGWSRSTQYSSTYPAFAHIYKIDPVRIFQLQGNKVQGVSQGKIRIKETGDIAYVDPLGFVTTGSFS